MIHSFWKVLVNNKKNVYFSIILFITGILIGYFFLDQNHPIVQGILKQIGSIAEKVKEKNSLFFMIKTIFLNNLFIAILMIMSGVLLGIYPIVNLMVQGIMIGFLIQFLFQQGKTIGFVLVGILPHGILEIPAILIASSFGIQLGIAVIRAIGNLLSGRNQGNKLLELKGTIKQIPIVILGLTVILFVAAIIESTITVYLLQFVS